MAKFVYGRYFGQKISSSSLCQYTLKISILYRNNGFINIISPRRLSKIPNFMYENERALDDLVTRKIEPFGWGENDFNKVTLNIYSDFSTRRRKRLITNLKGNNIWLDGKV